MLPFLRRGAEDALHDSEERFRGLFEEAPVAYHEIDTEGIVRRVNRAESDLLGFEPEEMLGKPVWEFVAPEEREASRQAVRQKVVGERRLKPFQREYVRRDGVRLTLEIHERLIHNSKGAVVGIRSALLDITERKLAQERLQEYAQEMERNNGVLAMALAAAREATDLKSRFLANMSHEIRTPMNGVLGMVELLLSTSLDREQREYAEAVKHSAEALLTVINDVLDFSKIEAGKLEMESVPFDLGATLEEVCTLLSVRAHEKNIELNCLIAPEAPRLVRGDPMRLRQVITNLIGNAIKFTERGEVLVCAEVVSETADKAIIRIRVEDSGIGIPHEFLPRLFESFVQADGSSSRKYGGTGLGLAISRQLVEMMGGQIDVQSEPGRGSVFSVTVPFDKAADDRPAQPVPLQGVRALVVDDNATNRTILRQYLQSWGCVVEEVPEAAAAIHVLRSAAASGRPFRLALIDHHMPEMDGFSAGEAIKSDPDICETVLVALTSAPMRGDSERLRQIGFAACLHKPVRQSHLYNALLEAFYPRARAVGPRLSKPAQLSDLKVLLADDNAVNRTIGLRILEKAGLRADAVCNGREAVEAVARDHYDVVLMDVQMPEMDGFEATAEIRRRLGPARCPAIIAMTANAMEGDRERCLAAGMNDYLSKPVRLEELQRTLGRWINIGSTVPAAVAD